MMGAWPPIYLSAHRFYHFFHDPTLKRWRSTSQDMFFPRCSNCLWFFSWAMTSISKPYLPLRQFWTGDWIPRAWHLSGFRMFPCPEINFHNPTSQHLSYYWKLYMMKFLISELDLQETKCLLPREITNHTVNIAVPLKIQVTQIASNPRSSAYGKATQHSA